MPKTSPIKTLADLPSKVERSKEQLRSFITKETKPGEKLPSRTQLSKWLGVSPMTVVSALSGLVSEGLIYSHQGKGYFVKDLAAPSTLVAGLFYKDRKHPLCGNEPSVFCFASSLQQKAPHIQIKLSPYQTGGLAQALADHTHLDLAVVFQVNPKKDNPVLKKIDLPTVVQTADTYPDMAQQVTYISPDYQKALAKAVSHLVELGHKDILMIRYEKQSGDKELFENLTGQHLNKENYLEIGTFPNPDFDQIDQALLSGKYTAVVAQDDLTTSYVLKVCYQNNIQIPRDLSVCSLFAPNDTGGPIQFTGVSRLPAMQAMGEALATMLHKPKLPQGIHKIELPFDLQDSTAPRA